MFDGEIHAILLCGICSSRCLHIKTHNMSSNQVHLLVAYKYSDGHGFTHCTIINFRSDEFCLFWAVSQLVVSDKIA